MIKIPERIRFGGVEYGVLVSQEPLSFEQDGETLRVNGACLPYDKKILIYNNPHCPSGVEETLIHEALEGMVDTYDMGLDHQTIKTLGVALHQFLAESKINFADSALNTTTH